MENKVFYRKLRFSPNTDPDSSYTRYHLQNLDANNFTMSHDKLEVFTTFLSFVDKKEIKAFQFKEHLMRLMHNALDAQISIPSVFEKLSHAIHECLGGTLVEFHSRSKVPARVRLIARCDASIDIHISTYQPAWVDTPIRLIRFCGERLRPELKSTQFAVCEAARAYALEKGAAEALLVSETGMLRECAWSNVFWFDREKQLWTTKEHILEGVTRKAIANIHPFKTKELTLDSMLTEAQEVFITQSTSGITAVKCIDQKEFSDTEWSIELQKKLHIQIKQSSETLGRINE